MPSTITTALRFGVRDVRDTYARSRLGPWWLTFSLALQVAALGLLFTNLLGENSDDYIPYLAINLVLWSVISTWLGEASTAYSKSENFLKQIPISKLFPLLRLFSKSGLVFLHYLPVILIALVFFPVEMGAAVFLVFPALVLFWTNLFWLGLVVGIFGARFRDVPPLIASVLMLMFYVTPIFWRMESIPSELGKVVILNPIFHLMNLVRSPLLGEWPALTSWAVVLVMTVLGLLVANLIYRNYSSRVVLWL